MIVQPWVLLERTLAGSAGGVDLHSHSTHSDGHWSPTALVEDMSRQGITVCALTDHDTVSGLPEALAAAGEWEVAPVTGAELSLSLGKRLFHILCYDVDPAAPMWAGFARLRAERQAIYTRALLDELRRRGHSPNEQAAIGPDGEFVANAAAIALHAGGAAPTVEDAGRLLRSVVPVRPVELLYVDVERLCAILPPGFGVWVVGHPARQQAQVSDRLTEADLAGLRTALPIVGLEAHHPYHSPADVASYTAMAARHGLLVTCGSDAHGWRVNRPPISYSPSLCAGFLQFILERQRVAT
ncbi:MAG: PHP domain-containing protein [Chloroflexi bacterium]|nr:PHP domain-containing protein [Chloroflexota bacterium]